VGRGWYVPKLVPAQISFHTPQSSDEIEIGNQIQVGSLRLKFTGAARYLGKKNLLAFDFTEMQISLADRILHQREVRGGKAKAAEFSTRSIATLPFFAFFAVTEEFIAARGRGGGLALWRRL
jgi:hypothetical protein